MTRRSWMLAVAILSLTAAGVWAGLVPTNIRTTKAADCCLDPACPPGCSEICPPDCLSLVAAKQSDECCTSCCCDDPTCPPGCTPECAAGCLPAIKASSTKTTVTKKDICPPCPSCPGW